MPVRANAKGPGEFVRDHLQEPQVGGRDYVGSMFQAYKTHLRGAGYSRFPCRLSFGKLVWLLKETGALVFDEAEPVAFGLDDPEALPAAYDPSCGMPAPRHYYKMVDPQNPAFMSPEAVWRQMRGLGPPVVVRRPAARVAPIAPPPVAVIPVAPAAPVAAPKRARAKAPTPAAAPAPALPKRPRTKVGALQHEADVFRGRIEAMRGKPEATAFLQLEEDMLEFFDRVLDTATSSRGKNREILMALAEAQEAASPGFELAVEAIENDDVGAFNRALDHLLKCCD